MAPRPSLIQALGGSQALLRRQEARDRVVARPRQIGFVFQAALADRVQLGTQAAGGR